MLWYFSQADSSHNKLVTFKTQGQIYYLLDTVKCVYCSHK